MGPAAPVITFDDGNASDVEIALPELARRKLEAVFFLLAGRLDQPGSLKSEDVTVLARAGHRIGLHGADHVDWRGLDATGRAREFTAARERLSALAGHSVDIAAAPFGLYDRQTLHDLRQSGLKALYTSDRGLAWATDFIRPRNCLEGTMDDTVLEDTLRGRVRLLRSVRRAFGIPRKRFLPLRLRS
jgi:peptidoglycan/xylan/chitin deacetylase (PgdA/CDA1 family)